MRHGNTLDPSLVNLARLLAVAGVDTGETGQPLSVHGRTPRSIEMGVRQRLIDEGVGLPRIVKTFDPVLRTR